MRHNAKAGTMTGGMAIVEALIANGVDTMFGLPDFSTARVISRA